MSSRLTIPPDLKRITQYIRRAEELDHDKRPQTRIVAYYCRQYAVQTGITLSNSDASRTCLSQMLSSLETEKQAMSTFTKEECSTICTKFALDIFNKADNEDRSGVATKNTAKIFYAAAVFLKIIEQFHDELEEELLEKWKYARWKAMDINKAINEGREVVPGGHGEMEAFRDVQTTVENETKPNDVTNDIDEAKEEGTEVDIILGPPPSYPVDVPPLPPPSPKLPPPSPKESPPKLPPSSLKSTIKSLSPIKSSTTSISPQEVLDDALELTRFALAALEAKDVDLGRNRLEQALFCLKR